MEPKYEAIIEHNSCEKYILASVNKGEILAVVSIRVSRHREIVEEYQQRIAGENKTLDKVLGGGMLSINRSDKKIMTFDMSAQYGSVSEELVEKVLRATHPDYELEIKTI